MVAASALSAAQMYSLSSGGDSSDGSLLFAVVPGLTCSQWRRKIVVYRGAP